MKIIIILIIILARVVFVFIRTPVRKECMGRLTVCCITHTNKVYLVCVRHGGDRDDVKHWIG